MNEITPLFQQANVEIRPQETQAKAEMEGRTVSKKEEPEKLPVDLPSSKAPSSSLKVYIKNIHHVRTCATHVFKVILSTADKLPHKMSTFLAFPSEEYKKSQEKQLYELINENSQLPQMLTEISENLAQSLADELSPKKGQDSDTKELAPTVYALLVDIVNHVANLNGRAADFKNLNDNQIICGLLLQIVQFVDEQGEKKLEEIDKIKDSKLKERKLLEFYTTVSQAFCQKVLTPNENDPLKIGIVKHALEKTLIGSTKQPLLPSLLLTMHLFYEAEQNFPEPLDKEIKEIEQLLKKEIKELEEAAIEKCEDNQFIQLSENAPETQKILNQNTKSFLLDHLPESLLSTSKRVKTTLESFIFNTGRILIGNLGRPSSKYSPEKKTSEHIVRELINSALNTVQNMEDILYSSYLESDLEDKIKEEGDSHPIGAQVYKKWFQISFMDDEEERDQKLRELCIEMFIYEWAQANLPGILEKGGAADFIPKVIWNSQLFWTGLESFVAPFFIDVFDSVLKIRYESSNAEEGWAHRDDVIEFKEILHGILLDKFDENFSEDGESSLQKYPYVTSIIASAFGVNLENADDRAEMGHAFQELTSIALNITLSRTFKGIESLYSNPVYAFSLAAGAFSVLQIFWNPLSLVQMRYGEILIIPTIFFCKSMSAQILPLLFPNFEKDLPLAARFQKIIGENMREDIAKNLENLFEKISHPKELEQFLLNYVYKFQNLLAAQLTARGIKVRNIEIDKETEDPKQLLIVALAALTTNFLYWGFSENPEENPTLKDTMITPVMNAFSVASKRSTKIIDDMSTKIAVDFVDRIFDPEFPKVFKVMVARAVEILRNRKMETLENAKEDMRKKFEELLISMDVVPQDVFADFSRQMSDRMDETLESFPVLKMVTENIKTYVLPKKVEESWDEIEMATFKDFSDDQIKKAKPQTPIFEIKPEDDQEEHREVG